VVVVMSGTHTIVQLLLLLLIENGVTATAQHHRRWGKRRGRWRRRRGWNKGFRGESFSHCASAEAVHTPEGRAGAQPSGRGPPGRGQAALVHWYQLLLLHKDYRGRGCWRVPTNT
jgi:hypothetical protein